MDRKEALTRCFFDTETWYRSTDRLRRVMKKTGKGSRLYQTWEELALPALSEPRQGQISVTEERTLETARRLAVEFPEKRIGILNFASGVVPGGGVRRGAIGQEESLCRSTTLYADLAAPAYRELYYKYHREQRDPLYTDACIYSPEVMIIKTDEPIPSRLEEKDWAQVDVVSCAPPNLRALGEYRDSIEEDTLYQIHVKRARRILAVAALNDCEFFITGAFGCGPFRNPPELVARAWKEASAELKRYFDRLIFAVPANQKSRETNEAFREVFDRVGADEG